MASRWSQFQLETAGRGLTGAGIRYALIDGPNYTADRETQTANETYIIRSQDVLAFHLESLPPPIFATDDKNFIRAYRRLPGAVWFITKSIDLKPFNQELPGDPFGGHLASTRETDSSGLPAAAGSNTYSTFYEVTINYETAQEGEDNERDEDDPVTFLEHSISGGGQFLSVPPANTTIDKKDVNGLNPDLSTGETADQVNDTQQMGLLYPIATIEHTLKWPLVLNPDFEAINAAMNKVNNSVIDFFNDAPIETVLFSGYSGSQKFVWNGSSSTAQPWTLDFKFTERRINRGGRIFGWNHHYHPGSGEFVKVKLANGEPLFEQTDFAAIFKTNKTS